MPGRPLPPRLPAADASTGMAASHRHTDEYMARFYAALSLDAADVDPHALAHEPAFSTAPNARPLGSGARSTGVADPPLGPPPLLSGSAALAWLAGPDRPPVRAHDASDRPLLCLSVSGDSAVAGGADHSLHEVDLSGCWSECGGPARADKAAGRAADQGGVEPVARAEPRRKRRS